MTLFGATDLSKSRALGGSRLAMAAILVGIPITAAAQIELLDVPSPPPPIGNFKVIAPVLRSYADCIVQKEAGRIPALLGTHPQTTESSILVRRIPLEYGPCIEPARAKVRALSTGQPRPYQLMIYPTFRGDIVEALYRRDFPGRNGAPRPGAPRSVPSWPEGAAPPEREREYRVLLCAARRSPRTFKSLLSTDSESPEEEAGLQGLIPSVSKCLPKDGALQMGRSWMRVLAAEAFYRSSVERYAAESAGGRRL